MRLSHRRLLALPLFLALCVPAAFATPLAAPTFVTTTQGGGSGDYTGDTFVVDVAGTLTLVNADLRAHDVVSVANGPDSNPWCGRYATGDCPLFASRLAPLGGQAVVEGTEQLTPLESYEFYCSLHPWMTGTLIAI